MIVHCVKTGGACLRVVATRVQRAPDPIFSRPAHTAIISLIADADMSDEDVEKEIVKINKEKQDYEGSIEVPNNF